MEENKDAMQPQDEQLAEQVVPEGGEPTAEAAKDDAPGGDALKKEQKLYKAQKPPKTEEQKNWEAARKNEFKTLVWGPWLRPVVALVAICMATSLLLGLTNMVTQPIIEGNARVAAEAARTELLPEADGFTEMDLPADAGNVTAMYKADNGAGYIIEAYGQGYGGKVPVMVAFAPSGTITGVTFLENSETQGLGTKLVTEPWFAQQFVGMPSQPISITGIDTLANATISSGAAVTAINAAIDVFNAEVMGSAGGLENAIQTLLPGEELTGIIISADGVQPQAYRSSAGNHIIVGEAEGFKSTIVAAVAMDEDGVILNLWLDTSGEANAATLGNDMDYVQAFIGQQSPAGVDTVAAMTGTTGGVDAAINNALAALPQAKEAV